MTDFREIIKEKIEKKNVTIAKVSRLADMNSNTLYTYLRGETDMCTHNLEKVLNVLNDLK